MSRRRRVVLVRICVRCQGPARGIPGDLPAQIVWLRRRRGDDCGICGKPIRFDLQCKHAPPHVAGPSIDHIIKQADGGCDHAGNLQLTHTGCNNWRDLVGTARFFDLFTARVAPLLR